MSKLAFALDKTGGVTKQPPFWAALALVLALGGGQQGKRAVRRGGICYLTSAVVANLVLKPIFHRRRPPRAGRGHVGPYTSSFPSGHSASDMAFAIGSAREWPALWLPMAALTTASHWSLVRTGSHHVSDVIAADIVATGVALALGRRWAIAERRGSDRAWSSGPGRSTDKTARAG